MVRLFGFLIVPSGRIFGELVWFLRKGAEEKRDGIDPVNKEEVLSAIRTAMATRVRAEQLIEAPSHCRRRMTYTMSHGHRIVRRVLTTFDIAPRPYKKPKRTVEFLPPDQAPDRESITQARGFESESNDCKEDSSPAVKVAQLSRVTARK
jgi:hypothetical protein